MDRQKRSLLVILLVLFLVSETRLVRSPEGDFAFSRFVNFMYTSNRIGVYHGQGEGKETIKQVKSSTSPRPDKRKTKGGVPEEKPVGGPVLPSSSTIFVEGKVTRGSRIKGDREIRSPNRVDPRPWINLWSPISHGEPPRLFGIPYTSLPLEWDDSGVIVQFGSSENTQHDYSYGPKKSPELTRTRTVLPYVRDRESEGRVEGVEKGRAVTCLELLG